MMNLIKAACIIAATLMLNSCVIAPPWHRVGYYDGYYGGYYHGYYYRGYPYRVW